MDEMTRMWRKLLNEEMHDLCSSPSKIWNDQIKEDKLGRACSTNGRDEKRRKRSLGRPRRRWIDNIKLDVKRRMVVGVDSIGLDQDKDKWKALVNTVMNLQAT
jgi:hypothetical protein